MSEAVRLYKESFPDRQ